MESTSLRFLSHPTVWWWIGLALAAAAGVWTYYRLRAPISPGWVWVLRCLRLGALGLVLLPLLEPVLNLVGNRSGPAPLLVMVDGSQSMGLRARSGDEGPEESRLEAARKVVKEMRAAWGSDYDLHLSTFARHVELVGHPDSLPRLAAGSTALGDALEEALTVPAMGTLSGVVLLSDGVNTAGKDPTVVARNSPVPVYTLCLGDTVPGKDLLIRQIQTNPEVTLGETLPFSVTLEAWGQEGRQARLDITEGAEIVASRTVVLTGDHGEAQDVRLEVQPRRPGLLLYTIRAALLDAEDPLPMNNERLAAVDVRERARRLLVIDANPSWDFTFVKRTLEADSSLVATFLVQDLVGRWRVLGAPAVSGWPADLTQWRQFSAVLLSGEVGAAGREQDLVRFVEEGGGLFFLHGSKGWANLPKGRLGDLLPLKTKGPRPRNTGPAAVRLTESGQVDPLTLIHENPLRAALLWSGLPPIWPAAERTEAKPGARVLLRWDDTSAEPAFLVAGYGKGRVAALAGQGIWRWIFVARSSASGSPVAEPFLRQTVRWLMEPSTQDRFQVVAARKVFQSGEQVEFEARLRDAVYEPLSGARGEIVIRDEEGRPVRTLPLIPTPRIGEYEARTEPLAPGAYRFEARISPADDGQQIREGRFWIEPTGVEVFRTWSDPRGLEAVARASGGGVGDPEDLPELRRLIKDTRRRTQDVRQAEIWNHWILFASFVLLLGAEWFLRRRRGLA